VVQEKIQLYLARLGKNVVKLPANDTVYKITALPRWQRNWINSHRSINYSGLVQEMLCDVIRKRDPDYYAKFIHHLEERQTRKMDVTKTITS
jgi:hypothetical protein